jgi:hypothetical protein
VAAFSVENPWVQKLFEFIPALETQADGRYPVGVTLMRGVADLLSALYGGGEFVLRMLDAPEEIDRVVEGLTAYWIDFGKALLQRLPRFHGGTGSFFYGLWTPGEHIWLQEDAIALLSPALYERFIYPADCRIAAAFERTVMHLHPARYIPSRLLAASPLAAVELHVDHDGPRAAALEPHYREILARKPLFVWGDLTENDIEFLFTRLPAAGLAVNAVVETPEQAWALRERVHLAA